MNSVLNVGELSSLGACQFVTEASYCVTELINLLRKYFIELQASYILSVYVLVL